MGTEEHEGPTDDEETMQASVTMSGGMPTGSDAKWTTPMPNADATHPESMPENLKDDADAAGGTPGARE